MADFNKPEVTQTYIQLLQDIRDNQEALAKMFAGVTPSNTPTGAVRFTNNRFSTYNGSAWVDTPVGITGGGTGAANPGAARTALSVLEAGTSGTQARNNAENEAKFVDKTRIVSTSGALSGGGDLSANRALTVRDATTSQTGVVQLESGLTSTSTTTAATASTVKQLKDAVDTAQAAANVNQASISNATDTGTVTNTHSRQVNASTDSTASGYRSQVNASTESTASGDKSQVNASRSSKASGYNSQVNASVYTESNTSYSSVWGFTPSGPASAANQQIRLESNSGVGRFKGNVTTSGFDYAEYFPNLNKGVIPNGTIVTLSEDKVKPAQEGDFILGVVSGTSGIIGNSAEFCWHKRHLVDEFGVTITEDAEMVSFDDYYGLVSECSKPIPSDAKRWIEAIPVENPDYVDISSEYQSRGERKEDWSIIGLMGQVFVRTSEQLEEGDNVSASGSKSTQETRLRVMKMTTDFDLNKGYGVAFCLIK